jgi:hypothetical protein
MQDGEGVPVLVREAKEASGDSKRDFVLQMLAQVAPVHPDAGAVLVEQARADRISDVEWAGVIAGLAGDQFQIGETPNQNSGPPPGLKTYHIAGGNQNFYSLPLAPGDQVHQRLALIGQLLEATVSNPVAQTALRSAQASLTQITAN